MAGVTVTLGAHTFEAGPAPHKIMTSNIPIIEIPDGVDHAHYMGRTNKEITLTGVAVTKLTMEDLQTAWLTEAELALNIPNFEESKTCRIIQFEQKEKEGIAPQHVDGLPPVPIGTDKGIIQVYYEITLTVVLTS